MSFWEWLKANPGQMVLFWMNISAVIAALIAIGLSIR